MPVWLIPLLWELIKLLPQVVAWIREHKGASKKDAIEAFPDEVKGLLKKLKDKREGVGSAPDLVG